MREQAIGLELCLTQEGGGHIIGKQNSPFSLAYWHSGTAYVHAKRIALSPETSSDILASVIIAILGANSGNLHFLALGFTTLMKLIGTYGMSSHSL